MWQRIILSIALLTVASIAHAAPPRFYVGGSIGTGLDLDARDLDLSDFGVEDDDNAWKLFGGVSVGRVFGVEAAYHDFGTFTCCDGIVDAGFDLDLEGVSAAVVAGIPISRLRLFAKAGVLAWEADGSVVTFAGPLPFSASGEDLMGGVGADVDLTERLAVRAEWEFFAIGDGSLDSVSAGLQFRF